MSLIWKLALTIALNIGALWVAERYVGGFDIIPQPLPPLGSLGIPDSLHLLIAGGTVAALANAALRPFLKVIGALLPLITFAMLSVVFNGALLFLADAALAGVAIAGLTPLLVSALLLGVVNAIF